MSVPLNIDVVSDFVCPWCFVGKRQLLGALTQLGQRRPEVATATRWLPYFLNPDTPAGGEPYRPFLERKFGGGAQVDALQDELRAAGKLAGVPFAFEKIALRPNTLDAHRLIYRAQAPGSGVDAAMLSELLFAAHFCEGRDIGDADTLLALALAAGDREEEARAFLSGGEGTREVLEIAEQVTRIGIRGVPFFIFGRRIAVSGAQAPETLLAAMLEALAEGEGAS